MSIDPPKLAGGRRVRKRYRIPLLIVLVLAGIVGWLYWRGTVAESRERDPQSVADGAITQLLTQDGRTFLRCGILVDAPPATVWKVVRDYESQADFLPYLSQISSKKLDDGRVRITGVAHSRIWGDWPFESHVREHENPETGEYSISWDERESGEFAINHGSWRITPAGDRQTLLVYSLQVEMARYPDFLVRALMRERLAGVLRAVRDEVARRERG